MPGGEQRMVPAARPVDVRTYYDRPVLKRPTWRWYIPAYFWAGGLAAGSSLLAAGAQATADEGLARRSRLVALGALAGGAACLVADLGRPERFHHMLRVAKVSSPMSVGTWLLTAYGPMVGVAAATDVLGILPGARRAATWAAAALAPAIASYTAVLVSDTAVPAWHDASRTMPGLFVSSAATAAGGMAMVAAAVTGARPSPAAIRLALGGTAAEAAAAQVVERTLAPEVRTAWQSGRSHRLSRWAGALGVAGSGLVLASTRRRSSRWATGAGGALIAVGSAVERLAVMEAGMASAADPKATTAPQRRRLASG